MGRLEIRDFDGDLKALAALAYGTLFSERGGGTWLDLNRPEAAQLLFADVPDPRFLIGVYDGARLVAFIANLPRRYRFDGREYRAAVPTMLAAGQDYRGAVPGLLGECLRRNREFGADLALFYLERGSRSHHLFKHHLMRACPIHRLKTMHAIVRVIDMAGAVATDGVSPLVQAGGKLVGIERPIAAPPVPGIVRPYQGADLPAILALMQGVSDRGCLVRVFDEATLARRLHTEGMTSTLVYQSGSEVMGFANFTVHELLSRRGRQRWAWVDFLGWQGLSGAERQALLAGVWQAGRQQECVGVLEWNKGYYGSAPLYRAGFIPYPLTIEVNAWLVTPDLSLNSVSCLCEQVL